MTAADGPAGPERWVLDVGNTRTAFGRVGAAGRLDATYRTATPRGENDAAEPPPWAAPTEIHGVCVVPEAARRWDAAFARDGLPTPVWWGVAERPVPVRHPYAPPLRPGPDRLVAAREAHLRAGGAVIVVDAGSALTVDAVAADGTFLGGAIAPGFTALAKALAAAAPALPKVPLVADPPYPGRSTVEAVTAGVAGAARGAVRELVAAAERATGGSATPYVCGGDAATAAAYLADRRPEVAPDLVLEGLARLVAAP